MLLHGVLLSEIHVRAPAAAGTPQPLFLDFAPMSTESAPGTLAQKSEEAAPVEQPRVLRRSRTPARPATGATPSVNPSANPPPSEGSTTLEDLRSRSLQMARRETVDPFAGQRVRALSPQTRDSIFGPYEEAYRQKVEQVGRVNYPPPVDGRPLYGMVRVTATIRQDGSLALIEIRQPSGSPHLDDAARRIIQMAAPFQPFTEAMRAEADMVSITRSFNFVRAGEGISIK
jgi:protein TonB